MITFKHFSSFLICLHSKKSGLGPTVACLELSYCKFTSLNILLVKHANCYGNLYAAIYMDKSKPKEVKKKWNVGLKVLNQQTFWVKRVTMGWHVNIKVELSNV